ncbi:MAG: ATP-dependent zinc protease [Pseudomonadales bacterium]
MTEKGSAENTGDLQTATPGELLTVGWREWVHLPDLGLPPIKAKVDTGARTSALHAFALQPFVEAGRQRVEFNIHPIQLNNETVVTCVADVIDQRVVTDSGGHKEERWVIETTLKIGSYQWPIEMTLTSRDDMRFRMLLGRNALKNWALVDSSRSYIIGKKPKKKKRATHQAQDATA